MSLLSYPMARTSEKRKHGGKSGENSSFLLKKTVTRFNEGQYSIFGTNTAKARPIKTPFIFFLGRIHRQRSFVISVSLSDVKEPIKGPCTLSLLRLPKQSLVKTPKKPK